MEDALGDYMEQKTTIGVMGGHSLWRHSSEYASIVWLCYQLCRSGFAVVTGGGPGAMEAANLGGYLFQRSHEEVEEALMIIARDKYVNVDLLWCNDCIIFLII
jgi:predicted Rossmann-fold nucleotide-binding protein